MGCKRHLRFLLELAQRIANCFQHTPASCGALKHPCGGAQQQIRHTYARDLTRTHISHYNDDAERTKGMYRLRTQEAWGHTAHRGWARLLPDRARDLTTHGPAHNGASNGQESRDNGKVYYEKLLNGAALRNADGRG